MSELAEPEAASPATAVRTHLGWAIVSAVLFFLPLGLVAVYHSVRTQRLLDEGRLAEADRSSHAAKHWLVAAIVVGVLIYLFLGGVLALLGAFSS